MPIISLLCEIFPETHAPYTLREIHERIVAMLEPNVKLGRVSHAYSVLADDPATAAIVKPLSDRKRYYQFTAPAARLITRRVLARDIQKILRAKSKLSDG